MVYGLKKQNNILVLIYSDEYEYVENQDNVLEEPTEEDTVLTK